MRHLHQGLQQLKASRKVAKGYDGTLVYQLHAAIGIPLLIDAAQGIGDDPEVITGVNPAIDTDTHGLQGGEDILTAGRLHRRRGRRWAE